MASYKFIGGDGKTYGPFSIEKLQQFMAENRLNAESQIQKDGGAFASASTYPELMPAPAGYPATAPEAKPGKVQAIGIMTLVGGILAALFSVIWLIYALAIGLATFGVGCVLAAFPIYQMVAGILCIINGAKMVGQNPHAGYAKAKTTAILQIICIICCDWVNLTLGILSLVFMGDPQVRAYMRLPAR